MALTATATQGFESLRSLDSEETILLPGTPGVTFNRGDVVKMTNGLVAKAGDSEASAIGVVTKTVTVPSATSAGFPVPKDYNAGDGSTEDDTLVMCTLFVSAGCPIFKSTFNGQYDDTVAAYNAATPSLTLTTGLGADSDAIGGLIYVYEGTGAGQVNVVAAYDEDGGEAGAKVLTLARKFKTDLSTDSKIIILRGATGAVGIGFFGRCDLDATQNQLDMQDGSDDGDYIVVMDFRQSTSFVKNLTLPVARTSNVL
jgi:hypothetical protein